MSRWSDGCVEGEPRGPGRPAIGRPINTRLGNLEGDVDDFAKEHGLSRADAIRSLIALGLRAAPFVLADRSHR